MKQDIKGTVEQLCKKYGTRSPFEIARQRRILIQYEPLGTVRGYYNTAYKQKIIHINSDLDGDQQFLVCAHELGHSVLHPNANTPFFKAHTLFSVSKMETEANRFMIYLTISDDELMEYSEFPMSLLADVYGVPMDLVRWRYEQMAPLNGKEHRL